MRLAQLALFSLLALAPVPAAFGHAELIATEPADGAVVTAAPENVAVVFNEPVSPVVIRLFDPSGHGAMLADVKQDGSRLTVALPRGAGEGTYVVSWRVVSSKMVHASPCTTRPTVPSFCNCASTRRCAPRRRPPFPDEP